MAKDNDQKKNWNNGGKGNKSQKKWNNNRGKRNFKNNNNLAKIETIPPPLTYEVKADEQKRVLIEWKGHANKKGSEKLPIFNDTNREDFVRTMVEFYECYDMNSELKNQVPTTGALSVLRRMFKGNSKQTLNRILQRFDGLNDEGIPRGRQQLKALVSKFASQILGSEAYENQLTYLKTIKKPRKLEVFEWLTRIQNIVYILPFLDPDRSILTDEEIIRDIVLPNIPVEARMELKLLGGQKIPWEALVDKLEYIFVRLNYNQSRSRGGNNHFKKGGNNRRNFEKGNSNGKKKNHENFKSDKKSDSSSDDDKASDSDLDSDSDSDEETHMMARKARNTKRKKKEKPNSCSILVSVPQGSARNTFMGLVDTGTSASFASSKAVKYCQKDLKRRKTDWST